MIERHSHRFHTPLFFYFFWSPSGIVMMTRLLYCLLSAVLAVSVVHAGTVTMLPMKATMDKPLTIEYRPAERDLAWTQQGSDAGPVTATVLWIPNTEEPATAVDVPMKLVDGRYTAVTSIPAGAVAGIVQVGNGMSYDTNNEMYWEVLVHNPSGTPLEGAHFRMAMANLGTLPSAYQKSLDQEEALRHLVEETKLYGRNTSARINEIFLMANTELITAEEAQARLRELVGSTTGAPRQPSDPTEALAIANAQRQMGMEAEAAATLALAAERFPASRLREQKGLDGLNQAKSAEDFVRRVINHLQQYPESGVRNELIGAAINAGSQHGDMALLADFLKRTPNVPAISYYNAVNYIGAVDSLRPTAFAMIAAGLTAADGDAERPSYISPLQWKQQQRIAKSLLYFVKGAMLQGTDLPAAAEALEQSVQFGGAQTDKASYELYVGVLSQLGKTADVLRIAEQAIRSGASAPSIVQAYRTAAGAEAVDDVDEKLAEMTKAGKAKLTSRLAKDMLNQPMIDGTFTTMDGTPIKISDWKDKVVILDFWATWCGPCRKSFPAMQRLYEKYKDHPNVQFAIVNVWERSDNRTKTVRDFLAQNTNLTFPMFFDLDDATVSKYGVTGIPTKFYLGRDGRIQFKEVGYLPDEQFIEDATNKIEVLLEK